MPNDSSSVTTDPLRQFPGWKALRLPADIARALVELYRRAGATSHGEPVSQLEHGLQCASFALAERASDELVVASFLHDIGHLVTLRSHRPDRDLAHERTGSEFLTNWLPPAVTEPIRLHVDAKRYLCGIDPSYQATLSSGSSHALTLQGGPFTRRQVALFDSEPHAADTLNLRRWDDRAKVRGVPTVTLPFVEQVIAAVLLAADRRR